MSSAVCFHLDQSKTLSSGNGLNLGSEDGEDRTFCKQLTLSQTSPDFLRICSRSTSLLETLWEKEKLLVTSTFSFSHSVFYPFGEFSAISLNLKLSSANTLSLEESKICCLEKG